VDDQRLYNSEELSDFLGSTPGTLAQWRFHGKGPRFVKIGRNVRYRASDVNAWLDAQTREQTGERASV
jgi:predicted DNA-binding transcriptional regulator AlpA